ncbi:MAG: methyltransferase domain-containing protein [Thermoleophilaceae bacterium]
MLLSPTEGLKRLADGNSADSFSHRLRERRFVLFEQLASRLPRPLSIIDIGGTTRFWERRGWADREEVTITLVNLEQQEKEYANIIPTVGDATDLSEHEDKSFDIAFSNSVIEHLFTFDAQAGMASEVRRVAGAYWVQTPNFWFPIEPHFLVPAWHWLPESTRVAILRRRGVGWAGRCPDPEFAREVVQQHRLMRRHELARLFPGASIVAERFGGLVKSWTAVDGFPGTA